MLYVTTMLTFLKNSKLFQKLHSDDKGIAAVEYATIAALIVAALYVAVPVLGTGLSTAFSDISTKIAGSITG